jgi:hypothetical protein
MIKKLEEYQYIIKETNRILWAMIKRSYFGIFKIFEYFRLKKELSIINKRAEKYFNKNG